VHSPVRPKSVGGGWQVLEREASEEPPATAEHHFSVGSRAVRTQATIQLQLFVLMHLRGIHGRIC
jgi:hypothetical protein